MIFDAKVGVGVDVLWKALSKDLRVVVPKAIPHVFEEEVHVIEGDGGLGTIYLLNYRPGKNTFLYVDPYSCDYVKFGIIFLMK